MNTHKVVNDVMLVEMIGKGAYSEVYRGLLKRGGSEWEVAVKVIPRTLKNSGNIDEEIQILRAIKHPNIVSFLNQYNTKNNTYVITELCGLGTFKKFISRNYAQNIVPEEEARRYFRQICLGVRELHRRGIVHRDLKPDNIFITADFQIKIGDFGFAKLLGDGDALQSFKGTPVNMAPEIFKTDVKLATSYDAKCDVWSLGTVLYEMVFGEIIATNVQTMKELSSLLLSDRELEVADSGRTGPECRDLIGRMLRKNPKDRADMEEVLGHPWLGTSEENPLLTSVLIKSFYQPKERGIQEISQEVFVKGKLKKWVCLAFKNSLRKALSELAGKIGDMGERVDRASQVFMEFTNDHPDLPDLTRLLWSKICLMIERFGKVRVGCEKWAPGITQSISDLLATIGEQHEFAKLMEQGRVAGIDLTSDSTGGDLLRKLYVKYFEVAEAAFRNEYTADADTQSELTKRLRPFQLQLLRVVRMLGFEFVGLQYEITFSKALREKELAFDPYAIESYLDEFEQVDEDDFVEAEVASLGAVCSVRVEVEYQEGLPEGQFAKAVEVFARAFKNRFESLLEAGNSKEPEAGFDNF
jgi:serine/threonine protein kinase